MQYFQVDPFGAYLYTETGISILVHSLKERSPVTLYLDATGSIIYKIPQQKRTILYYCLALPGHGREAPPLPVCEMISSEHSIPPITFWLMQFLLRLSKYTSLLIHHIKTDYSWAMIQAVLCWSKMSVFFYKRWTFSLCQTIFQCGCLCHCLVDRKRCLCNISGIPL